MRGVLLGVAVLFTASASAQEFVVQKTDACLDILRGDQVWLRTMIAPLDEANREETYKVYTHILDFAGGEPITKGSGGLYTHHRGLFIGWKDTLVPTAGGTTDYDTWHMPNCSQEFGEIVSRETGPDSGQAVFTVLWKDEAGAPFIREVRSLTVRGDSDGMRVTDFASELTSQRGTIQLKGDLQHAGMQVRLANEVSEHQDTTQYILPEGAQELKDDKVVGAWWVCCSAEVGGKRYWVLHMTPGDHPTGEPVYSIRRYARFGAFWEDELNKDEPKAYRFRIVVSEKELSREACAALYREYSGEKQ